jgi:hypothetical protein
MRLISLSLNFLLAGSLTASVVLAISTAPARADEQSEFKEKFKAGCASSNGSWIEDADRPDQYQCNAPSGDVNRCFSDTPPRPCVHINAEDCKFGC